MIDKILVEEVVKEALKEDLSTVGDITTEGIISRGIYGRAEIIAGEPMVVCGLPLAQEVFNQLDPQVHAIARVNEGESLDENSLVMEIKGRVASILKGERTALNFLGWLSGIATYTRTIARKAEEKGILILDTRKTTPTLRMLEKYAVRIGGGRNHRFGLYDAVLIKDNHIRAVGSISEAVRRVKKSVPHYLKIEVEVSNFQELREAIDSGVDIVMLDNMSPEEVRRAVSMLKRKGILIEVSGGIRAENIEDYLIEGVNYISIGALTHGSRWVNLSLEVKEVWR